MRIKGEVLEDLVVARAVADDAVEAWHDAVDRQNDAQAELVRARQAKRHAKRKLELLTREYREAP